MGIIRCVCFWRDVGDLAYSEKKREGGERCTEMDCIQ